MTQSAPLAPLELIELSARLLEQCGDDRVRPMALALELWLANGGDFADVLGMARDWHSVKVQREVNRALAAMAARICPNLTGRPRAKALCAAASRYEGTSWPADKRHQRRPDGVTGLIYDILIRGPMPSFESLRKSGCWVIMGHENTQGGP